jgi:hypothetical protein
LVLATEFSVGTVIVAIVDRSRALMSDIRVASLLLVMISKT